MAVYIERYVYIYIYIYIFTYVYRIRIHTLNMFDVKDKRFGKVQPASER